MTARATLNQRHWESRGAATSAPQNSPTIPRHVTSSQPVRSAERSRTAAPTPAPSCRRFGSALRTTRPFDRCPSATGDPPATGAPRAALLAGAIHATQRPDAELSTPSSEEGVSAKHSAGAHRESLTQASL